MKILKLNQEEQKKYIFFQIIDNYENNKNKFSTDYDSLIKEYFINKYHYKYIFLNFCQIE